MPALNPEHREVLNRLIDALNNGLQEHPMDVKEVIYLAMGFLGWTLRTTSARMRWTEPEMEAVRDWCLDSIRALPLAWTEEAASRLDTIARMHDAFFLFRPRSDES